MRTQIAAAGAGLVLLASACGADPADAPAPPIRPIAAGTPIPTASSSPPPAARRDWTAELGELESTGSHQVVKAGDHFIMADGMRLLGITEKGKNAWKRTFPEADRFGGDLTLAVAGGVPIVSYRHPGKKPWPWPNIVAGIDPKAGKTVWKTETAPYESVVGDVVYTSTCRGTQTEAADDCRLSARDPRTGAARWTVPTEHVPKVFASAKGALAMTTRPLGFRGKHWLITRSTETGARLGVRAEMERFGGGLYPKGEERVSGPTFMSGGTVVLTSKREEKFPESCDLKMVALDARTGARKWKHTLPVESRDDPDRCDSAGSDDAQKYAFGRNKEGRPVAFDLEKGKTRWTGPPDALILAGAGDHLLVRVEKGVALYDLSSGDARWTDAEFPPGWQDHEAVVRGDRLLAYDRDCSSECHVRVYDLEEGLRDSAPRGEYAGSGENWIATKERTGGKWQFGVVPMP